MADTSGLSGSVAETVSTDTVKAVLREGQEASGNRQVLTDAVRYGIKGTLATHILRRGESLARLAQKYYGNKRLWPYLARYNRKRISDVDNVPVGTVILIPELVPEK